jgi:GNAT superfamily N-acetyltransferase
VRLTWTNPLFIAIMKTEFRRAILPKELARLVAFDHRVFPKSDWFTKSDWRSYESYWMIVDGVTVGCCAFEHHVDFQDDPDKENPPRRGSVFIATTGILPRFQGKGFGHLLKCWQIVYAHHHGFTRIVTNHRKSNRSIIELNQKFGFKIIRRPKAKYFEDPPEPTVVMELRLPLKATRG